MARLFLLSILIGISIVPSFQSARHGFKSQYLHVNSAEKSASSPMIIEPELLGQMVSARSKRDVKMTTSETSSSQSSKDSTTPANPSTIPLKKPSQMTVNDRANLTTQTTNNITTMINQLNDSHAQLMVHWLGEGTNVMLCLAREPPPGPNEDVKTVPAIPSSVYISYNNGDTFDDKTYMFQINDTETGKMINSSLDQFTTHPTYNTIVFTDPKHKVIFTNTDYGRTIKRHMLNFTPSEVSFYEHDSRTFLVLDKTDRKLYYTVDFGDTFTMLQSYVKSFSWSSSGDSNYPVHLYVEHKEPDDSSSVIFMNAGNLLKDEPKKFNLLIENVQDFHIKKDFMFATRRVPNNTQLFISYQRGTFVKADFQTELEIKGLHIADVEGRRIMISAVHSETTSHLYVSESDAAMKKIRFVPSLEQIFTYIPELTWKSSWLTQTSDEAFTDLYKVEGMRGIYIASKIISLPPGPKVYSTIGPRA